MKRLLLVLAVVLLFSLNLTANYFSYLPYTITQPDGDTISCFVSGDEYFNWIHDQEGYTIIQASDGYFYYGETSDNIVIPTKYKVSSVNPAFVGLEKWAKISVSEYQKSKAIFADSEPEIGNAPQNGTLNNIVIYIRFSDSTEFTNTRQNFDNKFNLNPGTSLKTYFSEVSYNQLTINSTHYPDCAMTTNYSYQDSHPSSYFQPYNATTNPGGYQGGNNGSERTSREHTLLKDAINWINANSPVSGALNLDGDNDGNVDNVCFNIRGNSGGWACLLWAHSWSLFSYNVYINSKRINKYTFQPENQIGVQTLCHEMFHALGAPDLYHYTGNGINPVSGWDLMESGFGHMGAYMKWKYTNHVWISSIPEITASGTYTLNPLGSPTNNCFKIASPNSTSQFYIVEYRRKVAGSYENNLPGSGLLVYRINSYAYGNASGPPDEVYIYRPDGTTTANGSTSTAFFSSESGRVSINNTTNPSGFLQDGSPGGLIISDITSAGNTISFTVNYTVVLNPSNFTATPSSESQIDLAWKKNAHNDSIILIYNTTPTLGKLVNGATYSVGNAIAGGGTVIYSGPDTIFNHTGLQSQTTYYYKLFSVESDTIYSSGTPQYATTPCGVVSSFPWLVDFDRSETALSCWSQEGGGNLENGWNFIPGNGENNPSSAHSGQMNACHRDYSTKDDLSRLNTPTIDLSLLENPTLYFWHTQALSGSNQDILSVYYKTSVEGQWTQLVTYSSNIPNWKLDSISLPNASPTYYISFEGNAKNGYGICLDDVSIRGYSTVPKNLVIANDTIEDAESVCYDATDTITVAGNDGSVEFFSGSTVNLIAGMSIIFLPGFHACEGSNMNAFITTESAFCFALTPLIAEVPIVEKSKIFASDKNNPTLGGVKDMRMKIFPNPNNGRFRLELTDFEGKSQISIINTLGSIVYQTIINNTGINEFELTHLNKGLYFVSVKNGNIVITNKIIVQ